MHFKSLTPEELDSDRWSTLADVALADVMPSRRPSIGGAVAPAVDRRTQRDAPSPGHPPTLADVVLADVVPQDGDAAPAGERQPSWGTAGGAAPPARDAWAPGLLAAPSALQAREAVRKAVKDLSAEVDGILQKQEKAVASEISRLRAEIETLQGRLAGDWGVPGQNVLQVRGKDTAASAQEAALDPALVTHSVGSSFFRPRNGLSAPCGICATSTCSSPREEKEEVRESGGVAGRPWLSALPSAMSANIMDFGKDMKVKVKDAMQMNEQDEFVLLKTSGWAQQIVRSPIFESFTLFVIALSAVWLAVDVDLNRADDPRDAPLHFQIADHLFCVYFTLEILVRFAAYASKRHVFRDTWFLFDSGLVVLTVVDTWLIRLVLTLSDGSQSADGRATSTISRLFRLLRLARMARMVRLVAAVPELMIIVRGMAAAARSVILTLLLLSILTYVFAVALRQVTDGTDVGKTYFRNVPASMVSLLLRGTIPDQAPFLETSADDNIFYGVLLGVFVLLGSLTLMNMLIGILVQVVSVVSATEQRNMSLSNLRSRMSALFDKYGVDSDGDKCISRSEFEILLTIPEAVKCMSELGVDVVSLVDYTDFIFEDDKELSFPDMFALIQQLRSGNSATVRDIVDLRQFVSQTVSKAVRPRLSEGVSSMTASPSVAVDRKHLRMSVRQTLSSLSERGSHAESRTAPASGAR